MLQCGCFDPVPLDEHNDTARCCQYHGVQPVVKKYLTHKLRQLTGSIRFQCDLGDI